GTNQTIAIISTANGRVIRRLHGALGKLIDSVAASPDGKTLYFVESHTIWAIPASDGEPRRLASGDGVAAAPDGRTLVIEIFEKEGPRLAKLDVAGGNPEPIQLDLGDLRLWASPLSPSAVGTDGRIVHEVDSADSWFERPAILDPQTGRVEKVPIT